MQTRQGRRQRSKQAARRRFLSRWALPVYATLPLGAAGGRAGARTFILLLELAGAVALHERRLAWAHTPRCGTEVVVSGVDGNQARARERRSSRLAGHSDAQVHGWTASARSTGARLPGKGAVPQAVPGGGTAPPLWPPGLLGWGARACAAVAHQDELEAGHVCGAGRAHSGPFQATDVRKRGANALSGTFMPGSAMATGPHYVWGLLHTRLKRWKGAQGHTGERAGEAQQGGCRRGASTHARLLAETLVCWATPWLPTRRPVQLERRWWPCRRSFPPTPTRMPPSAARTPQTRPPWTPSTGTCQQSRCHTHSCLACGDASPRSQGLTTGAVGPP